MRKIKVKENIFKDYSLSQLSWATNKLFKFFYFNKIFLVWTSPLGGQKSLDGRCPPVGAFTVYE